MNKYFKKIAGKSFYYDFEEYLNFFDYFGITQKDLKNAHNLLATNKDRIKNYLLEVEEMIKHRFIFFATHTKNKDNKFINIVPPEMQLNSRAYLIGVMYTATRVLIQEFVHLKTKFPSEINSKIRTPKIDLEISYNHHQYQNALRTYIDGMLLFIHAKIDNNQETIEMLANLDKYIDLKLVNLKDYKELFIWIWIWSQLKIGSELHLAQSNIIGTAAPYPELTKNLLELFEMNFSNDIRDGQNVVSNIEEFISKDDTSCIEKYKKAVEEINSEVFILNKITINTYLKILDNIQHTFSFFSAYLRNPYLTELANTIYKREFEYIDDENMYKIIQNLSYKPPEIKSEFLNMNTYESNLHSKPLIQLDDNEKNSYLITFPEIVWYSLYMIENFDILDKPIKEIIKQKMFIKQKEIIEKSILIADYKLKSNFFRFMNSLDYNISKKQKNLKFDQVFFDYKTNQLYFCINHYFEPNQFVYDDYVDNISMFMGDNCIVNNFVKSKLVPLAKEMKRLKKDFPIVADTKITGVIISNKTFDKANKLVINDYDVFVVNMTNVEFLFSDFVFRKKN